MNETLTPEEILSQAVESLVLSGALKSKLYTDAEVTKAKEALRGELAGLTGVNKEKLDGITALLDRADLDENGELNLDSFMQSIVARLGNQDVKIGENKTAITKNAEDLAKYKVANAASIKTLQEQDSATNTDVAQLKKDVVTNNAVATSNQKAIQKLSNDVSTIQSKMDEIFAGTDSSDDDNAL